MTKFEKVKNEALGNFGLITAAAARNLGANGCDLDRWVRIGWMERPSRGVYRLSDFPPSKCDPYAIAVESVDPAARLVGESVLALLELTDTNPSWIYVGVTRRVRKALRSDIRVVMLSNDESIKFYEGVRCQPLDRALRACAAFMLPERIDEAVRNGVRLGLLSRDFAL